MQTFRTIGTRMGRPNLQVAEIRPGPTSTPCPGKHRLTGNKAVGVTKRAFIGRGLDSHCLSIGGGVVPLLASFCLVLCGCAALGGTSWVKKSATNGLVPTIEDFVELAYRSDDPAILKTTLESYLLLLETLCEESPGNRELLVLTSTMHAYYSFGFAVDEDLGRARKLYGKGIAIGKKALLLNGSVARAVANGEPFYKALAQLDPEEDVSAAYATALNQGLLLICSLDVVEAFAEANAFRFLCDWLIQHDEAYFHGAAHTLLGVYYAIMPAVAGGGPEKARQEFEKGIALDNRLLMHYWAYARYYPTLVDDETMFDELIRHILEADASADPSLTALNVITKNKARILDEDRNLYF